MNVHATDRVSHDPTVLVIDIGTSSVKAAVMTGDGRVLSHGRRRIMGPSEASASFDADRWIDALGHTIPYIVSQYRVDAVVISGNGPTVVAVDRNGMVIDRPLLWLDRRTAGAGDTDSFYLPKIAWFDQHAPGADRVRWYLPFPEYLLYRLTGEAVAITPSDEFSRYIWTGDEAKRYGVDTRLLPPFVSIGAVVGRVTASAAEWTSLAEGTPVVAGGSDFLMSLLGTNTLRPGRTCDRAGTSEGINHCTSENIQYPGLRTLPHVIPGLYNVAGILSSTGQLFEWFREISGQESRDYGQMMLEILNVPDDADVPWFFPSVHRGAAWEFQKGMFIGLGAEHDSAAMGRAVVLSIGFAVRETIEILGDAGAGVHQLNACGGQAKNGLWTQMKADIVGVPISVPEVADAELTGNLCAGLVGLGEAADLQQAAEGVVRTLHLFEPDPVRHSLFGDQYHHYRDRYAMFRQALESCS
ncbi:MAG: xylulokinase [Alkalispirochaeta sp.]